MCIRDRDNVDYEKRRRYEFVYGKLHDFEDYMRSLGVDVDLTGRPQPPLPHKEMCIRDSPPSRYILCG